MVIPLTKLSKLSPTPHHKPAWGPVIWMGVAVVAFIGVASVGYRMIEDEYTWLDAIYMTIISLSTVGYQEVGELTHDGRLWTLGVIVVGMVTAGVFLTLLVGAIIEGRFQRIFGRRQMERKIASLKDHIIVCGYGRMGAEVAGELAAAGQEVVVIDIDPERVTVGDKIGLLAIRGDAQDEEVLQAARLEKASVLVACLREDADNLFVTLSARQARPDIHIVARAEQEASQRKLLKAGANSAVCPQAIGARRVSNLILRPAIIELADMAQQGLNIEVNQLQVSDGSDLADKTLAQLELPRKLGAHVVAVRHTNGQAVYHPKPETKLAAGDTLILVGESGSSKAILEMQDGG